MKENILKLLKKKTREIRIRSLMSLIEYQNCMYKQRLEIRKIKIVFNFSVYYEQYVKKEKSCFFVPFSL